MSQVLVAYFSATGTTARVARAVVDACGGDLFEIAPQTPYTSADLIWTNPKSRCCLEHSDTSCRPKLSESVPDLGKYDTLLVGFPIWWGVSPRPVDSFLDEISGFKGRVVAFATSGGSSSREALQQLRSWYPHLGVESVQLLNDVEPAAWVRSLKL